MLNLLEGKFGRDQRLLGLLQLLFIEKSSLRGLRNSKGLSKDTELIRVGVGHLGDALLVLIRD